MGLIQQIAGLFEPWQTLYSESTAVSVTVTTVHIVTLLVAGGLAIAADRASLRALNQPSAERSWQLAELGAVHRPVIVALAALFLSGLLLAAADIEIFAQSTLFWFKMGLVALLLVNGLALRRTESRLAVTEPDEGDTESTDRLWQRLALRARTSIALWVAVAVAGTVLTNT